jgi:hypothetical protein
MNERFATLQAQVDRNQHRAESEKAFFESEKALSESEKAQIESEKVLFESEIDGIKQLVAYVAISRCSRAHHRARSHTPRRRRVAIIVEVPSIDK